MELKVDISFEQLVQAIKQLPASKIRQLKAELSIENPTENHQVNVVDFQKLLLTGPVMGDKQYKEYKSFKRRL